MNNFKIKKNNTEYKIIETGSNKQMLLPENCKIFITCENANIIKEYFKIFSISAFIEQIKQFIINKNYYGIKIADLKEISKIDLNIIKKIVSKIINIKNSFYTNSLEIIKQIKDNITLNDEQLKEIKDNIDKIDIKSDIDKEIKILFIIDINKIKEILKEKENIEILISIDTFDLNSLSTRYGLISIDTFDLNSLSTRYGLIDIKQEVLASLVDINQKVLKSLIDIKGSITKLLNTKINLLNVLYPNDLIQPNELFDKEIEKFKIVENINNINNIFIENLTIQSLRDNIGVVLIGD